jgi:hypothetical protein
MARPGFFFGLVFWSFMFTGLAHIEDKELFSLQLSCPAERKVLLFILPSSEGS